MKNCFIVMPITTPDDLLKEYGDDGQHFIHILEHLFIPCVEACGLQPILPLVAGSDVIHGEIVKHLSVANLVLCDMSQLNPNVFFEFGIRTALNKSVALVVDNKTKRIPFDTGIINYHRYESDLRPWIIEDERAKLSKHIEKTLESDPDKNALWKYFGVTQTAAFTPDQVTDEDKFDLILNRLDFLTKEAESPSFRFNLDTRDNFPSWREAFTTFQKDYFNQLLQATGGRKDEAIRLAGMSKAQFYEKLRVSGS
jgi:hypothetical protein